MAAIPPPRTDVDGEHVTEREWFAADITRLSRAMVARDRLVHELIQIIVYRLHEDIDRSDGHHAYIRDLINQLSGLSERLNDADRRIGDVLGDLSDRLRGINSDAPNG